MNGSVKGLRSMPVRTKSLDSDIQLCINTTKMTDNLTVIGQNLILFHCPLDGLHIIADSSYFYFFARNGIIFATPTAISINQIKTKFPQPTTETAFPKIVFEIEAAI